jgi:hypothetical protein
MRVPGRAHKRPKIYRATAVVVVVVAVVMRLSPPSLNCGTNCMTMMNTHKPMAVSMVAGRVRRTGVGAFARRSSDMTDPSEKLLRQNHGQQPRILGQAVETIKHKVISFNKNVSNTTS